MARLDAFSISMDPLPVGLLDDRNVYRNSKEHFNKQELLRLAWISMWQCGMQMC